MMNNNSNRQRHRLNRQESGSSLTSDYFAQHDQSGKPVRKLVTPNSSLEIVDGDLAEGASGFGYERSPSDASFRSWSRSSVGSIPPRSDSSLSRRNVTTPTKQVSLQAVRRLEESSEPFVDHIDVEATRLDGSGGVRRAWDISDDDVDFSNLTIGDHRQPYKNQHKVKGMPNGGGLPLKLSTVGEEEGDKKLSSQQPDNKHRQDSSDDDDDDDEEGGDEDKDENEKLKAPTELLMEFIDCLMKKDYSNASKLCKMILMYEPENEEALKFQPLIEEKMTLDAEADEEGSDEDDDDDDDDDDSDDDSSSDDDDDDSSEDEDDDNKTSSQQPPPPSLKPSQDSTKMEGANSSRVWKPAS